MDLQNLWPNEFLRTVYKTATPWYLTHVGAALGFVIQAVTSVVVYERTASDYTITHRYSVYRDSKYIDMGHGHTVYPVMLYYAIEFDVVEKFMITNSKLKQCACFVCMCSQRIRSNS